MADTAASDVVYDLISIQYHALKESQLCDKFIQDAAGNKDVVRFLRSVKTQNDKRAQQAHDLLAALESAGGLEAAPAATKRRRGK